MIRRLFNKQINSITVAAVLVAASSLVSKLLGIVRDRILADRFGAGETLDVYYAAFRIPDLLFNLLVLGALSAGFIPIFTGLIKDMKCDDRACSPASESKKAWDLVSNIMNILIVVLSIFSVFGIIFARPLMDLIAPGFSPELKGSTADLTRIMFLSPIFLGISSILSGVLQSFKRFFVYSLAPVLYNTGIIIGAVFFAPVWGIYGLAWGVVLGTALHMAVQLPMVLKLGFKYKPFLNLKDPNLRKLIRMMVPRTLSLAVVQLNLVVITIIASGLMAGSLAIFNLANNLQAFPISIFGVSFAIAAFPTLSRLANDKKGIIRNFSNTFRQILFFIVPSTVLLITLRAQIIRVILGTGKFDWEDTILTMDTLGAFALSLFAQATIPLLIRMFYARHDSKTPFLIGFFSVASNIALSLILAPKLGVAGLALAFSISNIINFVILWLSLHFVMGGMDESRILISVAKFSLAAIAAGFAVQIMKVAIWPFIDMSRFFGVFSQGAVAGSSGILVYVFMCFLLGSEELFSFWSSVKRKLFKVKPKDKISSIENV